MSVSDEDLVKRFPGQPITHDNADHYRGRLDHRLCWASAAPASAGSPHPNPCARSAGRSTSSRHRFPAMAPSTWRSSCARVRLPRCRLLDALPGRDRRTGRAAGVAIHRDRVRSGERRHSHRRAGAAGLDRTCRHAGSGLRIERGGLVRNALKDNVAIAGAATTGFVAKNSGRSQTSLAAEA